MKASAAAILCAYYYTSKAGEEAVKAVEADWPQTHTVYIQASTIYIYIYMIKRLAAAVLLFFS